MIRNYINENLTKLLEDVIVLDFSQNKDLFEYAKVGVLDNTMVSVDAASVGLDDTKIYDFIMEKIRNSDEIAEYITRQALNKSEPLRNEIKKEYIDATLDDMVTKIRNRMDEIKDLDLYLAKKFIADILN